MECLRPVERNEREETKMRSSYVDHVAKPEGQGFQPRLGDPERVALRRFCNALFLAGVCGLTMWWRPLHAQPRDVRLVDAVKRRDDKAFAALLRAKADVNAKQPDGATALA